MTPSWEQRKFSAVAIERRETTEVEDEDLLLTCAIEGIFLNSEYFSHFRGQSNIGYLKVRKNMLILSAQNLHLGNANVNLKYDHGIISPAYKVYDLLNCSPLFMHSWVKRPNANIFFDQATTAGASLCRKNIEWDYLNNLPLCLPASLKEQHQIGSFFARLDNLITLHQRKCQYRSLCAYLSWEQRKFSDIVDVCSGKDYKHLKEGSIPVYGTGGFMTSVDEALSHDRDAVGIGRKGTIDKPYLLKAPFWTVDTLFYAIPKSDIDLEFVHCSFLNVDWKSKDESTGLPSLSKEAINETIALVPSFNEQSQLGGFFKNLDSLITLHQRQR